MWVSIKYRATWFCFQLCRILFLILVGTRSCAPVFVSPEMLYKNYSSLSSSACSFSSCIMMFAIDYYRNMLTKIKLALIQSRAKPRMDYACYPPLFPSFHCTPKFCTLHWFQSKKFHWLRSLRCINIFKKAMCKQRKVMFL